MQLLVSLIHSLLLQSLLYLRTTLFIRNSFLLVRRLRILRKSLLCRTRCSFRQFLVFVGAFPPVEEFTAYVARRPSSLVEVRPSVRAQRHARGGSRRVCPHGANPRCPCAADGGLRDGRLAVAGIDRLPSRLSQCPQFLALRVRRVLEFLNRSQRISWLKCRQSCLPRASLFRIAEQIVDTPVPHGRARGSLPEQSSAARRPFLSSRRRIAGRIWHMPAAGLYGYIESDSAKAAYAIVGDVPFFLEGSCRLGDHVTFAVGRGAVGLEAYDLKVVGRG